MVLSGIAMAIFDSRIIHRWLRKIKNMVRKSQRQENVELGEDVNPPEVHSRPDETQAEPQPIKVDSKSETSVPIGNRRPQGHQENVTEPSTPRVRAEDVMIPYSILTGLIIFATFIISFIVVMVVRGVVQNAPVLFQFFANMYLAGISSSIFPTDLL